MSNSETDQGILGPYGSNPQGGGPERHETSAMKIYFCDGCNESIPLADIQAGQVTTIKGKLFCRTCIPPGGTAGGPTQTVVKTRTHPLLIVLLLMLVAWTAYRDLRPLAAGDFSYTETRGDLQQKDADARFGALEQDVTDLRRDGSELERRVDFYRGDLDQVRAAEADLSRSMDQLRSEIDRLLRSQAETGELIEKMNLVGNRMDLVNGRVDTLGDMVARLEQTVAMGLIAGQHGAATGEVAATSAEAGPTSAQAGLRRQLLDDDPGQRFDAVSQILEGRNKEFTADLIPMLQDEDPFVRILAMEVLGEFGAVEAVPELFTVLESPSAQIRKTAAETLVRLTGYDPGYDPRASQGDRTKAVAAWRKWMDDR